MERGGGGSLDDFPRKVSEAVSRDLQEDDLVLLQELPRAPPGWQQEVLGKWKMVGCRSDEQWRGTGIMFQPARWNVMRRLQAPKGTWYRLRHAQDGTEIWAGTVYLRPDLSQDEHAVALQDFLKKLPATQLPVIVPGDPNSEIAWGLGDEGAAVAFGRNGKTLGLLHSLASRGLHVRPPSQDQWTTPTTHPRQEGRTGKQIDFLACARAHSGPLEIVCGSHAAIGTDHDVLALRVHLRRHRRAMRTDTRPRKLMQPLGPISSLDQEALVELAKNQTKPKTGSGHRDPADVKALFGMARFSKDKHDWKVAFQARRKASSEWERTQLAEAVQGNWGAFRKIRKKNDNKREMAYADAQDDPHQSIHAHFQQLYSSEERVEPCMPELPFEPISMEELKSAVHGGKSGVSVGQDGTSQELLIGVMNAEGGAAALLTWFNNLLYSGVLPDDWYIEH